MALMVPLVLVVRAAEHHERLRSPLLKCGLAGLPPTAVTRELLARLPARPPVRSIALHGSYDWSVEIPRAARPSDAARCDCSTG